MAETGASGNASNTLPIASGIFQQPVRSRGLWFHSCVSM